MELIRVVLYEFKAYILKSLPNIPQGSCDS